MKQEIIKHIISMENDLFNISKYLYENPEESFCEHKAHDYLINILKQNNFEIKEKFLDIPTAFMAKFGDGHPKICYICEYDCGCKKGHIVGSNLVSSMSIGAAIGLSKVIPKTHRPGAAHLLADLRRRPALVAAVVELHEVLVGGGGRESGQLGGPSRPQPGAHPHGREPAVPQLAAQPAGLLLTLGQQRQVGDAGVLAAETPLRLPVPQHHDLAHGPPCPCVGGHILEEQRPVRVLPRTTDPRHPAAGRACGGSMTTVAPSDTFSIGGDLPVHPLGYGAMQPPRPRGGGGPAVPENARRGGGAPAGQGVGLLD